MGAAVVARYSSLGEAQIVASALRSAGIHPWVFDDQVYWSELLGGFRVAVPRTELEDAVSIVREMTTS